MKRITVEFIDGVISRYAALLPLREAILAGVAAMSAGGKVLVCGNGGSCADGEHIIGELMKEFRIKRPVGKAFIEKFNELYPGDPLPEKLAGTVAAISLSSQTALATAIANDVGAEYVYAQQIYGYCAKGDVLIAVSTSGNALNVINAAKTARAMGGIVVALTGAGGGRLKDCANIIINVPETETYKVQELHLPVYHALCAGTELELWG